MIFLILFTFFIPFYGQANVVLTVKEAVNLAMRKNFDLAEKGLDLQARERRKNKAFSVFLPSTHVSASTGLATDLGNQTSPNNWKNSLSLSLTLEFSSFLSLKEHNDKYQEALLEYDDISRQIEKNIRRRFYELLLYQEKIRLEEQKVKRAQERLEQTSARNQIGLVSNLDFLKEQVALEKSRLEKEKQRNLFVEKLNELKNELGLPLNETVALSGSLVLSSQGIGKVFPLPDNHSPALQKLQLKWKNYSRKPLEEEIKGLLPTLSVNGSVLPTFSSANWSVGTSATSSLEVNFSLDPWFPWTLEREKINQLIDDLEKLENQIEKQQAYDASQRERNLKKIEELHQYFSLSSSLEKISQKSYELSSKAYQQGLVGLDSLQRTQEEWENTRQEVLGQRFQWLEVVLELEYEEDLPFGTLLKE